MADTKTTRPAAPRPKRGRPINLYIDPLTERRLRWFKRRHQLRSISAAVAELARRGRKIPV